MPADLVLMCGVFGNITDLDVRLTIARLPDLCAPGAMVIWTRSRKEPGLTPALRSWFSSCGFEEVAFDAPPGVLFSVGVRRLVVPPGPLQPGSRLFSFV